MEESRETADSDTEAVRSAAIMRAQRRRSTCGDSGENGKVEPSGGTAA